MINEGNTSQAPASRPKWPELIRAKREELDESQTEFGRRFKVSHAAVSDWERGVNDPPAEVLWWLTHGEGAE